MNAAQRKYKNIVKTKGSKRVSARMLKLSKAPFFRGAARVIDLGAQSGTTSSYVAVDPDEHAIAADWRAVGDDLRVAIDQVSRNR